MSIKVEGQINLLSSENDHLECQIHQFQQNVKYDLFDVLFKSNACNDGKQEIFSYCLNLNIFEIEKCASQNASLQFF